MRGEYVDPRPQHVRATTWCFDWWNESISWNRWLPSKSQRGMKYLKAPWQQHLQIRRKLNKNRLASILNARRSRTGNHFPGWQGVPFTIPLVHTSFSVHCQCGIALVWSMFYRFLDVSCTMAKKISWCQPCFALLVCSWWRWNVTLGPCEGEELCVYNLSSL